MAKKLLSLNLIESINKVAVVLSIFLKLRNDNGMALKPAWQVKEDGGMGLRAHVSLEKNGHP